MVDPQQIIDIVEMWTQEKHQYADSGTGGQVGQAELNNFVEHMNYRSRQLLVLFPSRQGNSAAEFWQSFGELALNMERICAERKIFVDKSDASQRGM